VYPAPYADPFSAVPSVFPYVKVLFVGLLYMLVVLRATEKLPDAAKLLLNSMSGVVHEPLEDLDRPFIEFIPPAILLVIAGPNSLYTA